MKPGTLALSTLGACIATGLAFLASWTALSQRTLDRGNPASTHETIAETKTVDLHWDPALQSLPERRPGERPPEEALQATRALCGKLGSGDGATLDAYAERQEATHPLRGEESVWLITVANPERLRLAHARWDARSGALEELSWTPEPQQDPEAIESGPVARRLAGFWLQRLAPRLAPWQVNAKSGRQGDSWNASARSGMYRATLKLEARSGQLLWVRFEPGVTP